MRIPRPAVVLTALLLTLALLAAATGGAVAQPLVRFGPPASTGAFGEEVSFSTTFRSDEPPTRVELLARLPGDDSDRVTIASVAPDGDGWRATVVQSGHVVPNSSWEYRFRVVTDQGSAVGPTGRHRVLDTRFEWDVLRGERVNVWTYEGGKDFARRALEVAEGALDSAAELLGVDNVAAVDFLIYTDTREFRQAMGPATRENVGGQAHPAIRTLFGLIEPRQVGSDWVEELITHELAHLVFHEAVDNPVQYPPRWLNEGVAVYLSRGHTASDRAAVEGAAASGTIIPLEGLGGQFPTRSSRQSLAYAESIDAFDHFLETHGEPALAELVGAFRQGLGLEAAFEAATGEDFAAFDADWLASLGAEPPEPYGPQESQPGPQPEVWQTVLDTPPG
jgi:hypothetical protein